MGGHLSTVVTNKNNKKKLKASTGTAASLLKQIEDNLLSSLITLTDNVCDQYVIAVFGQSAFDNHYNIEYSFECLRIDKRYRIIDPKVKIQPDVLRYIHSALVSQICAQHKNLIKHKKDLDPNQHSLLIKEIQRLYTATHNLRKAIKHIIKILMPNDPKEVPRRFSQTEMEEEINLLFKLNPEFTFCPKQPLNSTCEQMVLRYLILRTYRVSLEIIKDFIHRLQGDLVKETLHYIEENTKDVSPTKEQ